MNRAARLRLRRLAPRIARRAAEGVVLLGDDGGLAKVDSTRAQAILRRQIAECLRQGGVPVIRRLSEDEAEHFPHIRRPDDSGAAPWLAVALGLDDRISVTVRRLRAFGPGDPDAAVRARLLSILARMCVSPEVPGLERTEGRA